MARIRFACVRCGRLLEYGEECNCKETAPPPRQEVKSVLDDPPDLQSDEPPAEAAAPRKRGRPKKNKD